MPRLLWLPVAEASEQYSDSMRGREMSKAFRALIVEDVDGKPKASLKDQTLSDLQDFDVLVEIS